MQRVDIGHFVVQREVERDDAGCDAVLAREVDRGPFDGCARD